jgi:hypothetical protein
LLYFIVLYNAVQQYKLNKKTPMDAVEALEWLKNKEKEKFSWKVFIFFENNHLSRLFQEINLWLRFHDVVLCDSTYSTNIYKLRLCLLIVY